MILKLLTVTAMASFEIYVAIATGLGFGFDKWTILACTLVGGVLGVFVAAFLGQKIEHWINNTFRKNKEPKPKKGFLYNLWNKYGINGVGLIGTFLFGGPAAIAVGVGFNADLKKMVPLCLIAVVVRCFVFTFFGDYIRGLF